MKIKFRDTKLNKKSMSHLITINEIVADYQIQGYKLTLRQLYYQLVSRNIIANQDREYKKLSRVLTEGRMAGIVDWDAIEDRLRQPQNVWAVDNIAEAFETIQDQYRLKRQKGQTTFVEVWVEKDAISNVLKRVTQKYGINILVNRGYGSVTAMYDAFDRYRREMKYRGCENVVILYLGDHDPSGLDMIRDISERIGEMMNSEDIEHVFEVKPIALTMNQILEFNPPPNPAKITDSRSDGYIKRHGSQSWEVDALPPESLHSILEDAIVDEIDMVLYNEIVAKEGVHKIRINNIIENIDTDEEDQ
jgi:hypothetical protein